MLSQIMLTILTLFIALVILEEAIQFFVKRYIADESVGENNSFRKIFKRFRRSHDEE